MMGFTAQGGSWKECPQCGKRFFCSGPEWVYKRSVSVNGKSSTWYFCKYSCLRAFDDGYEVQKAKMRSENAKLQHKRQKQEAKE